MKRPILHPFRIAEKDETIFTREGPVDARRGDVILIGVDGEVWPIQAHKFLATYDILSDGQCRKKLIEVLAMHMYQPFQVMVSWQNSILVGHPGDWLVQYDEATYGIVGEDLFEKAYDVLGPSDKQINVGSSKIRISDQPTTL